MWRAWIMLGFVVTACAEFPEVDAALAAGAPQSEYPALLPFEQLLAQEDPRLDTGDVDTLRSRATELRNRADGLRGPVIDGEAQDRMNDGVQQP